MPYLIRHTHSSSETRRDEARLSKDFIRWTLDSNIITLAEADLTGDLLRERGWERVRAATSESCIAFDTAVWEEVESSVETLHAGTALFAVLNHKRGGKRLVLGVAPFPKDLPLVARVKNALAVKRCLRNLRRMNAAHATLFTAAWHTNLKSSWVRRGFKAVLPKMTVSFKPPYPKDEISEFSLLWCLNILQGPRLAVAQSSDRKAFRQVLGFRR